MVGGGLNGGYLLAVIGNAIRTELAEAGQPDPVTVSAYYLTPTTPGPAVVRVRRLRIGGQRSTVAASLVQQQDGVEVERITVLAVFGSLARMSGEVQREIPPPDLPPVEDCVEARLAPEEVRRMAPLLERFGTRLDPAYVGWAFGEPSSNGIIQGWFKLADDRPLDPIALLLVVDALPPVTFDLGLPGWAPTLELTAHVRARPAPGGRSCGMRRATSPVRHRGVGCDRIVEEDAQVNAYIATMTVKEYVRNNVDAAMPTLDEPITVNVNIGQSCNAFFDGKAINFFQASDQCQNTALIEDVIFHEFGHRLHTAELIPGVGDFDGAMSEGAVGLPLSQHHGRSRDGPRLFLSRRAAARARSRRHGVVWPRDVGEIHHTGMIYGGIFWDLRKDLSSSSANRLPSRSSTSSTSARCVARSHPDEPGRSARRGRRRRRSRQRHAATSVRSATRSAATAFAPRAEPSSRRGSSPEGALDRRSPRGPRPLR